MRPSVVTTIRDIDFEDLKYIRKMQDDLMKDNLRIIRTKTLNQVLTDHLGLDANEDNYNKFTTKVPDDLDKMNFKRLGLDNLLFYEDRLIGSIGYGIDERDGQHFLQCNVTPVNLL